MGWLQSKKHIIKYIVYFLLLILLYALQTTPRFLEIMGAKPVFVVPFAVCIALFENEMVSAIYGMLAGMLWDMSSNTLFGFNALILLCCCVTVSLFVMYLMRTKLLNALFFVGVIMVVQGLLHYVFYYLIWQYENSYIVLVRHILPSALFTVIMTIPVYFLVRTIATKFNAVLRM